MPKQHYNYCDSFRFQSHMLRVQEMSKGMGQFLETSCPFCSKSLEGFYFKNEYDREHYLPEDDFSVHEGVMKYCEECGWWYENACKVDGAYASYGRIEQIFGIMKEFDISSKETPIAVIKDYLTKDKSGIYLIHHRKLEQLIQDVCSSLLNCRLEITKQSRDGGYDLYGYDASGEKFIVEVKRYRKEKRVGISIVRSLLGAMVIERVRKGIMVTTSSYTSPAIQYSQLLQDRGTLYELELKDINDICNWLGSITQTGSAVQREIARFEEYDKRYDNYGNYLIAW